MKISSIHARQILDSRGNPTVEADVILEDGTLGRASVPSGASTGSGEALELRDHNPDGYSGQSVQKAVNNVNNKISSALVGKKVEDQENLDQTMIDLDGTKNKVKLGANSILSVSLAAAHAASICQNKPLYQYFHEISQVDRPMTLPLPLINIINGGKHANFATDIQEFMIAPIGAKSFSQALEMGSEVFHHLGEILKAAGYPITVGDEGGYALTDNRKDQNGNILALEFIKQAIQKAGFNFGEDIALALDVAASELFKNGKYTLETNNWQLTTDNMIDALIKYCEGYPIFSIEDGLAESDWAGWIKLTQKLGDKIQLVGDDLLVTNTKLLQKAIDKNAGNAILIKPNQIGTITETIQAVKMSYANNWQAIISHRSGETEDTTIAHLAVGLGTGQIKSGSMSRGERIAKYDELLRIEEELGDRAIFAGKAIIKR